VKKLILTLLLFGSVIYGVFYGVEVYLGRIVDKSMVARQADIIVSLGGDATCRIKKSLELYDSGYSRMDPFIFTGHQKQPSKRYRPGNKWELLDDALSKEQMFHINASKGEGANTMEELLIVKALMLRHDLKSVIVVSHPFHTGRIRLLAERIAGYSEAGLELIPVSCEPSWWRRDYPQNGASRRMSMLEIVKMFYNQLKYSAPLVDFTEYHGRVKSGDWEQMIDRLDRRFSEQLRPRHFERASRSSSAL
jgi:hypothetical protein